MSTDDPNAIPGSVLSDAQRIALCQALQTTISNATPNVGEAMGIALAVVAALCLKHNGNNVCEMAKLLQTAKNHIVSDFRSGRLALSGSEQL